MRVDVAWFKHATDVVGCLEASRMTAMPDDSYQRRERLQYRTAPIKMKRHRAIFAISLMLTGLAAAMLLGVHALPAQPAEAPPGAASCTGCHPARANVDTPVPRLAGRDAAELIAAMQAFRNGSLPATVMDRIAKGFSDDEIKTIAAWFSAQARSPD
jgi:cytochrome subunit of sulfide dehydrogenase